MSERDETGRANAGRGDTGRGDSEGDDSEGANTPAGGAVNDHDASGAGDSADENDASEAGDAVNGPPAERGRRVLVSLGDPDARPSADQLVDAGLVVDVSLDAVGVVAGWADAASIERLQALDGVTVEFERGVQLAPPDAPVQ